MSQNQEIIEAKLCAFIDGELDAEGRAEIEKHLEANPQHRRLLESLKATRDLVRWLPRESAPPELAETLNGQLERSVLLDYDGDSLRPRIFPRIFAAAAIIVLTAGLAAAVYFALPKSHRNATQIATNTEPAKPAGTSGTLVEAPAPPARDSEHEKDSTERFAKASSPSDAMTGAAQGLDAAKLEVTPELESMARQVAANSGTIVAAANGAAPQDATPASINNAVVMLVRTDTPAAAQKELTDYLTTNRIQWRPAESDQQGLADLAQQQDRSSNANAAANAGTQPQQTPQFAQRPEPAPTDAAKPADESIRRPASASPALRGATTQPGPESWQQQNLAQSQAVPGQSNSQGNFNNSLSNPRASNLYVARMSRGQARALSLSMNQGGQQAAEMKEGLSTTQAAAHGRESEMNAVVPQGGLGGGRNAEGPATQPAVLEQTVLSKAAALPPPDERQNSVPRGRSAEGATTQPGVIAVGDELRVVFEKQDTQDKKSTADEPAQTVRVSADGTVNVPNVGVFQCAGLTLEQANQAIAHASATNSAARGLTVETLKAEARNFAVDSALSDQKRSAGRASTQPASTEPLAAAQSPDEPVNVVIVVESNSQAPAPANSAAPTTQPAQAAPTELQSPAR